MTYPLRIPEIKTASDSLRVHILSSDHLVVAALTALLEGAGPVKIAASADEANVALWDVRVGDEAIDFARLPTVALIEDENQAAELLASGVRGVVLRNQVGPSIVPALQAARAGLAVVDANLTATLVPEHKHAPLPADLEPLTARENQVLELLTKGLSNKQIAARLDISSHTAKFHVNSILNKLNASTRTEAVVTAVRYGLVTL